MAIGLIVYTGVAVLFYAYLLITSRPEARWEGAEDAPSSLT